MTGPSPDELRPLHDETASYGTDPVEALLYARPSDRIGAYRVLRRVGQGGMGVVYLAERADDTFQKRVALKILNRDLDSGQVLARFHYERQILASLDHPNIARILDAGTAPSGVPYFAMEYVEGRPIDEYATTRQLSTADRLRLFRTVCSAVQYAHQNLVIHRDLKPANILVTEDGTVKLLDFGIAKILNRDVFPGEVVATQAWERLMTPAYASPEQVRGLPVTTATDVYSLGVILYELLVGKRPYELQGVPVREMERIVGETQPERPSTAVRTAISAPGEATAVPDAERVHRELKGDLDTIVLMALRKEPQRRYASAEQFGEDIRRHLERQPVIARESTWTYRAGKFIERHRASVAVSGASAIMLIALVAALAISSRRIARERDIAQSERAKAEAVSAFLTGIFKQNDPRVSNGEKITARELLDRSAQNIETQFQDRPELQGPMMSAIGDAYYSLGLFERALPLMERSLAARRRTLGNMHLDTASTMVVLADLYVDRGEYEKGEALAREAVAVRRKLLPPNDPALGEAIGSVGRALYMRRMYPEAEQAYRESVEIDRKSAPRSEYAATSIGNLGNLLSDTGRSGEAEPLLREALALSRELHGPHNPAVVTALNNLGVCLQKKGDIAAAEPVFRQLVDAATAVYGLDHPSVGLYYTNLGFVLHQLKRYSEAETAMRRGLEIRRKLLMGENPAVGHSELVLARLLADTGRAREAEPLARDAQRLFVSNFPPGNSMIADASSVLGWVLTEEKRYSEAEPLLIASYKALDNERTRKTKLARQNIERLIGLYSARGDAAKAAQFRQALDALR